MSKEKYYAQFGEDRILAKVFAGRRSGGCVEVGAFDGVKGSNSYYFEIKGWNCLLVEPNPELGDRIREARPRSQLFQCAVGSRTGKIVLQIPEGDETLASVSSSASDLLKAAARKTARVRGLGDPEQVVKDFEVEVKTLDEILELAHFKQIDFMTIDVEGFELDALRGFSLGRWRPRIVILEDNNFGSDDRVSEYMESQNYLRFRNTGCNDWYAHRDDRELVGLINLVWTEVAKTIMDLRQLFVRHIRRTSNALRYKRALK